MFCRALDDFLLKVIFFVACVIFFVGIAKDGTLYGYQEGVGIVIAIFVIVLASVLGSYAKEK